MCFSLSTKYSFSIWKLFFLEFAKYRRLHLPVNAPQTLKAFPNVPTTSFLWNSPFKYLLIQNLHLLLWGSPRCFCGSQYASEGIFANLAHTFDSLGWENSETQTFDVLWNRVFTGGCNRRVLYVYQEETCPSVAVGGFCSKGWKKTWLIAVEFCFQILCK